jgi:hypothetical protein
MPTNEQIDYRKRRADRALALLTTHDIDSARSYIRAMDWQLEMMGYPRQPTGEKTPVGIYSIEDRDTRYKVWLRESIAWACERLIDGNPLLAFRATLQVCEYKGAIGHDSVTHDAAIFLRNAIETVITTYTEGF